VKVELVNPHAWIHIEITKPDGTTEVWMVEGGSPNTLLRKGITKATLPIGIEVVVDGYQAKDHTNRANGSDITLPDGRKLNLGSSHGTGAPGEAEPRIVDRENPRLKPDERLIPGPFPPTMRTALIRQC